MNNPKISIIVPVYKAEKYLHECLDSILKQTYTDWECILVDDGSPDRSGSICDEYAKRDNRFVVIHKKNAGVSVARNSGIERADGSFITFVDADDVIAPDYLKDFMVDDADWIIQGFKRFGELNDINPHTVITVRYEQKQMDIFTRKHLQKSAIFGPCFKLFKREIIEKYKISYPIGMRNAEDIYFCLDYWKHCRSIVVVPECHYSIRYAGSGALRKYAVNPEDYKFHISTILKKIDDCETKWNTNLTSLRQILTSRFWNFFRTWLLMQRRWNRLSAIIRYTFWGLYHYAALRDVLSLYYMALLPTIYNIKHKES